MMLDDTFKPPTPTSPVYCLYACLNIIFKTVSLAGHHGDLVTLTLNFGGQKQKKHTFLWGNFCYSAFGHGLNITYS